jgi:hypothetical protein
MACNVSGASPVSGSRDEVDAHLDFDCLNGCPAKKDQSRFIERRGTRGDCDNLPQWGALG